MSGIDTSESTTPWFTAYMDKIILRTESEYTYALPAGRA